MLLLRRVFALLSVLLPGAISANPDFVHCYDFGCKTTRDLVYDELHWQRVRDIMQHGATDASSEKQAIREAVAIMESISGELAGTHLDKAGNYPGYDLPGQMDCIDESTNTLQYLYALQDLGLLRWHRVGLKQRRIVWFVTHWTATIEEVEGGRQFAVDSWYRDNGEQPYIQPLDEWRRKLDFPPEYNPELSRAYE